MKYDIFISYKHGEDSAVVNRIYDVFTKAGLSCFLDREDIQGSKDWAEVIAKAILDSRLLLFVASENSYTSDQVQNEITFGSTEKGLGFIFPFIIDGSTMPVKYKMSLAKVNWRTMSDKYRIEKELLEDVKHVLENPDAGETVVVRKGKSYVKAIAVIAVVVLAALAGFIWYLGSKDSRTDATYESASVYNGLLQQSRAKISEARALTAAGDPMNTFGQELECIDAAQALLDSACRIREGAILEKKGNALFFDDKAANSMRATLERHRDSMATVWRNRAMNVYQHSYSADKSYAGILNRFVDMALRLEDDPGMQAIKNEINQ